ncbi:1448_t:CDS:2, partial [Racocetra persica]
FGLRLDLEDPLNNLLFFNQESLDDTVSHASSTTTTTRAGIPVSLYPQTPQ